MFNLLLAVFDLDDDPTWDIDDTEAIMFLDIEQKLNYKQSTYEDADDFEDNLPIGYQGFTIGDSETENSWRVKGEKIFKYDSSGIKFAEDSSFAVENLLRNLVKKRNEMWYALSEPTKCVAQDVD